MTEYRESISNLSEIDKEKLNDNINTSPWGMITFVIFLWVLLFIFGQENTILTGILTIFSVFLLAIPFISKSMSKADLQDNRKIIRRGLITKRKKTLNSNSSPNYHWEIGDRKHIIIRSDQTYDYAKEGDFIEISRTHFGNQILQIRKISSESLNNSNFENSLWSEIE